MLDDISELPLRLVMLMINISHILDIVVADLDLLEIYLISVRPADLSSLFNHHRIVVVRT